MAKYRKGKVVDGVQVYEEVCETPHRNVTLEQLGTEIANAEARVLELKKQKAECEVL